MFPYKTPKVVFSECVKSDNISFMQQVKRDNKSYLHPNTTMAMEEPTSEFNLPGFRFHPNEEELLDFYLKKMALGKNMRLDIIGFLNIYRHDPWDLPGLAKIEGREWYFFVPRDRRHGSGGRPNRTTENGFWKATGSDRKIFSISEPKRQLGLRKTLVFYKGRAPRGNKTDWVMNEYRLLDSCPLPKDIVLCKIYRKATSLKVLEQRAALEEESTNTIHHHQHAHSPPSPITPPMDATSISSQNYDDILADQPMTTSHVAASITKEEEEDQDQDQDLLVTVAEKMKDEVVESDASVNNNNNNNGPSLKLPDGMENLGGLQLHLPNFNMDWTQDSFWTQLHSPWLDNLTLTPYAHILNF